MTELSADADGIKQNFTQIRSDVERIRSGLSSVSGIVDSAQAGFGSMGPIPGMFLSVPIMVVTAIICSRIEGLRRIAVILSADGSLSTSGK